VSPATSPPARRTSFAVASAVPPDAIAYGKKLVDLERTASGVRLRFADPAEMYLRRLEQASPTDTAARLTPRSVPALATVRADTPSVAACFFTPSNQASKELSFWQPAASAETASPTVNAAQINAVARIRFLVI